ncbi:hypothetical protein D3C73_1005550 [compost metagenome]
MTTCGRSWVKCSTKAVGLASSAVTSTLRSFSSKSRMPARTSGWSSARTIRSRSIRGRRGGIVVVVGVILYQDSNLSQQVPELVRQPDHVLKDLIVPAVAPEFGLNGLKVR